MRGIVGACLEAWLQDWSVRRDMAAPNLDETFGPADASPEAEVLRVHGKEGFLSIAISTTALVRLGCELASTDALDRSGVASEIGLSAVQDLLVSLAARAGEVPVEVGTHEGTWPDSVIRPELGAMQLLVTFGSFEFRVAMSRIWVDRLCPVHQPRPSAPLSTREASVVPTRVQLTAVLDFGPVNALELAGLAIGDVLVSERRFGHPVEIRAGDKTLFEASVCREGNHLALVAQNTTMLAEKT
jgi:hypothetical protein